jgi:hypothetical protein
MQTQRGLGASKVSAPSVGGSINIVTRTIDQKKGGSISYAMGNDGYNKLLFHVSTGMSKDGWALTLLGGKTWGDGYIQGTEFSAYNYFVNIAKRINDAHQISFTAFGSPQWHNQRSNKDGLSIKGWQAVKNYMGDKSPYRYNPTYGFGPNGERMSASHNEYHKPQLSLNHQWQINEKSSLSTAAYVSIGRGYGNAGQGYNMQLPTIPTDNLYKFMSISGILVMLFFFSISIYSVYKIQDKIKEENKSMSILEAKTKILERLRDNHKAYLDELLKLTEEKEITKTWEKFIHTHHYSLHDNFFDSVLAKFPRRTTEELFDRTQNVRFLSPNKETMFHKDLTFKQLKVIVPKLVIEELSCKR